MLSDCVKCRVTVRLLSKAWLSDVSLKYRLFLAASHPPPHLHPYPHPSPIHVLLGRAGVPMEVMGLMLGEFTDDYTINVIDVFAMPQNGTGVSVEAVDPGNFVNTKNKYQK